MRLFITLLSMGSVIAFGYALAGYGGSLVGRGRTDYIVAGLIAGIFCAAAALFLWKKNMHRFVEEIETGKTLYNPDEEKASPAAEDKKKPKA